MTRELDPRSRWRPSWVLELYARVLVGLRWFVLLFWLVVAGAALTLPALGNRGEDLSQLVSAHNPAVQTEIRSSEKFGLPLLSRVAVVQHNAHGIPADVVNRAMTRARDVSQGALPDAKPIIAAVPVINVKGMPAS